jgi:3-hydroxyisobutyrate dehydrogenase
MSHATRPRIAIIGLGQMGLPMCARLVDRGFAVTATDREAQREADARAIGASWAASTGEVAAAADVAITVLPGAPEVTAITGALLAALVPGATWIEMSSAEPATARAAAAGAAARGVGVLDAPVGGNPASARDGRLLTFVGGAAGDIEARRDVLDALADRVLHVGPAGSGYAVKLLVNTLWFGQAIAHAEALSLAARMGLDPESVRLAVQQSAAASRFGERDAPALLRGDDLASFSLARCCEQLDAVLALGRELSVPLELAERVAAAHEAALARFGDVNGELLGARLVAERAQVAFGDPGSSSAAPTLVEAVRDAELIEDPSGHVVEQAVDPLRPVIEGRDGRKDRRPG